jgi:hypothetical protein
VRLRVHGVEQDSYMDSGLKSRFKITIMIRHFSTALRTYSHTLYVEPELQLRAYPFYGRLGRDSPIFKIKFNSDSELDS